MEKYKQTIESFTGFLAECREQAKDIVQPITDRMGCAVCDGIAFLSTDEISHTVEGKTWKGTHWFYKCGKCNEEFTTTESDTLSLASMQPIEQHNTNA